MALASGIARTDTSHNIDALWGMGTHSVREAQVSPTDQLSHAKNEFAQGVAYLMEEHPDAVEQASAIVDRLFEAAQRAGPQRPHPIMWGALAAFIGLLFTVIGAGMKISGDYGELRQRVAAVEQQTQRISILESRQTESEKALSRIEQKLDDLKRDLERR